MSKREHMWWQTSTWKEVWNHLPWGKCKLRPEWGADETIVRMAKK